MSRIIDDLRDASKPLLPEFRYGFKVYCNARGIMRPVTVPTCPRCGLRLRGAKVRLPNGQLIDAPKSWMCQSPSCEYCVGPDGVVRGLRDVQ